MQKTVYEDYKYCMQDTTRLYVGVKYTMDEFLEDNDINFKLRMTFQKYVYPLIDGSDTLETYFYYMAPKDLNVKLFKQLKARFKVNVIKTKRGLHGVRREYTTENMDVNELVTMTREQKEAIGLVIQEISVSKLALLGI